MPKSKQTLTTEDIQGLHHESDHFLLFFSQLLSSKHCEKKSILPLCWQGSGIVVAGSLYTGGLEWNGAINANVETCLILLWRCCHIPVITDQKKTAAENNSSYTPADHAEWWYVILSLLLCGLQVSLNPLTRPPSPRIHTGHGEWWPLILRLCSEEPRGNFGRLLLVWITSCNTSCHARWSRAAVWNTHPLIYLCVWVMP